MRARCANHERFRIDAVRLRTRDVHRPRRHPPGFAPPLYAADVAHQRDLGHRRRRIDRRHGRRSPACHPHPRRGRIVRIDDQHRQRLHDHRPHAQDVQKAVTRLIGELAAVLATALFIFALHWMSDPKTARHGVVAGVIGMTVAVLATWIQPEIVHHTWIVGAIAVGFLVGVPLSRVPMTAVPQRTALSHAFGGLAVGLVGAAEYFLYLRHGQIPPQAKAAHLEENFALHFTMTVLMLEVLLGFLTFTGSLMAFGKLQEIIPTRPMVYKGQNFINLTLLAVALAAGIYLAIDPTKQVLFPVFAVMALAFGV